LSSTTRPPVYGNDKGGVFVQGAVFDNDHVKVKVKDKVNVR
jgi:hypothetical protein